MSMITRRVAWDPGVFSPGGWFDSNGGLTPERDQPGFFAFACALFCAGVFVPPEVCCQSLAGIHLRHSAVSPQLHLDMLDICRDRDLKELAK